MKNPKKFWAWKNQTDEGGTRERVLEFYGTIAEDSWFDDDITPAMFKAELFAETGPVTIWINSPGGDCNAASQIYAALMDYEGDVTVKIDGMAASAASVIAMAGTKVLMAPTAMMMIHNPSTGAYGDHKDMEEVIAMLDEVKEGIITAYEIRTGLSHAQLSHMMDSTTWMNAKKAKELGFCDEILYTSDNELPDNNASGFSYGRKAAAACLMNRVIATLSKPEPTPEPVTPEPVTPDNRVKAADLEKRLSLLK